MIAVTALARAAGGSQADFLAQPEQQPMEGAVAADRRLYELFTEGAVFGSHDLEGTSSQVSWFSHDFGDLSAPAQRHLSEDNGTDPSDDDDQDGRSIDDNETAASTTSRLSDDALFDGAVRTGRVSAVFMACAAVAISHLQA